MKPRKPPNTKRDLFPDTWVVGTAAAELAKNDEGVLLADDPDRVPGSVVEIQPREDTPSPAPVEPRRHIEEELAELRAENERLRRCIAGSRGDLEAMNWRGDDIVTDREGGFFADPGLYRDRGTRRRRRPGAGPRHARIGAALVIAVGIVAGAWLVGQRLATLEGPMVERMQTLRADIVGVFDGMGERAIAWVRPAPPRGEDPAATGMPSPD